MIGGVAAGTLALLLSVRPAAANDSDLGPDPTASALFQEGRALIDAGDWEAGCDKLEQSMGRYAAASTILNLAKCAEHAGQVATAWARYRRGLVLVRDTPGETRRDALKQIATAGIAALEPRLPRLTIVVTVEGSAEPPADLRVEEDGKPLPVGEAVVLDPGDARIVLSAPGFEEQQRTVTLREGELVALEVMLKKLPEALANERPTPPARESTPIAAPSAAPQDPSGTPAWVFISGGAGVVLGAVSAGFAIDAISTSSALEDRCGADLICDEDPSFDPVPDNDRKNRDIALSIGFGVGGGALLTTAVIGWLLSGESASAVRVGAGRSSASVTFVSRF